MAKPFVKAISASLPHTSGCLNPGSQGTPGCCTAEANGSPAGPASIPHEHTHNLQASSSPSERPPNRLHLHAQL